MPSETSRGLATLAREAVAPGAKAGKVRFYQSGEEVTECARAQAPAGVAWAQWHRLSKDVNYAGLGRFDNNCKMLDPEIAIDRLSDQTGTRQPPLSSSKMLPLQRILAHMFFPASDIIRARKQRHTLAGGIFRSKHGKVHTE